MRSASRNGALAMAGGRELFEPKLLRACPLPCSICTRTLAEQRNTRGKKAAGRATKREM
jgi:hypothetical protein